MKLYDLVKYLDQYLMTDKFQDYAPNGLQVEGNPEVQKIAIGVSANLELFQKAKQMNADTIIVHHGILWDFHSRVIKGSYKLRIEYLLNNNFNLLAYHLPLDAHPDIGNNIVACRDLDFKNIRSFGQYKGKEIGFWGTVDGISKVDFKKKIDQYYQFESLMFDFGPDIIHSIGIISGGAQAEFQQAINLGLDCYITGEVSEYIMHSAKEEKKHFISAGHYATERVGIKALGNKIKSELNMEVNFIDVPVPV